MRPVGLGRHDSWEGVRAVVAGFGASGFAAADNLNHLGASVVAVDESDAGDRPAKAELLEVLGADVRLGPGSADTLPDEVDVLVTSPGWRPTAPLIAQAMARGVPVWGEVELAWRLRDPNHHTPWLAVTGTNGKTTTVLMLDAILRAAGLRSIAVGNVGLPIVEAVMDPEPYDVLAVELSSFQLHWMNNVNLHSAVVLNVHPDHLEWYGGEDPMQDYIADKAKIYHGVTHSCVYNVAEPVTERMVEEADVVEGARAIGFTLGTPAVSMLGIVDDLIVDRAFVEQRRDSALELAKVADVQPYAPHNVANALAAAALARSYGVRATSVSEGLKRLQLAGHRIQQVAEDGGVRFVDDSKATNPHAANSAMQAYSSFVWIAGGQAKGTTFDDLIERHRGKMRGAVVMGVDRQVIAEALARHAPDVPVRVFDSTETEVMDEVVAVAAGMARPGDVVLLSPGCASLDMFDSYSARGDRFAEAVQRYLAG